MGAGRNPSRECSCAAGPVERSVVALGSRQDSVPSPAVISAMKRSKRRRWLRAVLWGIALAGSVMLLGGWLALRHVPSWYRPVPVPEQELQRVRDSLAEAFRDVSDLMVAAEPFEFTLQDATVSEWITARGQIWPDSEAWVPPWLRDPVVVFAPGTIILAAHLDRDGWESIVAVHLAVTVEQGEVVMRLERVTCGALTIPWSLLDEPLDRLIHSERLDVQAMPDELASVMRKLRRAEAGGLFASGVRFRPPFIWKNGDRPYRIREVLIGDGWLMLRIDPL